MKLIRGEKIHMGLVYIFSIISALLGIVCFMIKLPREINEHKSEMEVFAAGFVLPNKENKLYYGTDDHSVNDGNDIQDITLKNKSSSSSNQEADKVPEQDDEHHSSDEKTYKIIESQFGACGSQYDNFYIKKEVSKDINIIAALKEKLDFKIEKNSNPQVLIYHTHTSEAYMKKDQGFYYESFYPRSTDYNYNVTQVGNAISEKLLKSGINTIHDKTYHDNPSYNGSYGRSIETIKKNLSANPSIKVTLDIHRDALGSDETGKIKPTFKVNGKKAAQIMIITGCDEDGSLGFPEWNHNLRLALKIQQTAEKMYPGMTRPMYLAAVKYNMHITHGSLLIEVGTDANTLEEAKYSGSLLGDVLSEVLGSP